MRISRDFFSSLLWISDLVVSGIVKMAKKTWVLFLLFLECKALFLIFKTATVVVKTFYCYIHFILNLEIPMFWLDLHDELLCQEVILVQPYMYRPSTWERGNAWSRIADSLNSIDNLKFYVNQRSVLERFNLILTWYKTKISA